MSETTITCNKCGERVPRKRFCCECSAPLGVVNETSGQGKISNPVQVSDSVSPDIHEANNSAGEQSTDAVNKPPTSPATTTTSSHTDHRFINPTDDPNKPSYAEAARPSLLDGGKANGQQNNQGSLSNSGGPAGSTENQFRVTVTGNDGTAANVDSGASKQPKKV